MKRKHLGCGPKTVTPARMRTARSLVRHLDVRPLLARGEEPFSTIRRAVDALRPGEGLAVTAPFLPSPLIEKLGSEGFESEVEQVGGGAWTVVFRRARD
ncbi:MAG: DUF2249 domain-containing protein [Verrucomicrobia bacterium]|nr:DUF2249 domain-containing protein [Verrucomicrobiota bacterium]